MLRPSVAFTTCSRGVIANRHFTRRVGWSGFGVLTPGSLAGLGCLVAVASSACAWSPKANRLAFALCSRTLERPGGRLRIQTTRLLFERIRLLIVTSPSLEH